MEGVRDQGLTHVDHVSRRRSEAAPSIDAIYERSRARVNDHGPEVEPHGRRMSMPVQNGTGRRHSEVNDGRRRSVSHSNQVLPVSEIHRDSDRVLPPEARIPRHTREYRGREPRDGGSRDRENRDRGSRDREHRDRESRGREFSRPVRSRSGTTRSTVDDYDGSEDDRYVVPALPMPIAILCCILNFLVPGFGSMLAAFCVLCCARTEGMTCRDKCGSCCTVFGIGVLQLLLVACFLIGWIWSCIWGITFIGMSASFYEEDDDEYGHYPETPIRRRRQPTGNTPLPTPEVVVDQPYPGVRYANMRTAESRHRRNRSRRTLSRISLTPSNFIYPMRAPSSMVYNSPPPPYRERATPPPPYWRTNQQGDDRGAQQRVTESREERCTSRDAESNPTNPSANFRPRQLAADTIYEEHSRR